MDFEVLELIVTQKGLLLCDLWIYHLY